MSPPGGTSAEELTIRVSAAESEYPRLSAALAWLLAEFAVRCAFLARLFAVRAVLRPFLAVRYALLSEGPPSAGETTDPANSAAATATARAAALWPRMSLITTPPVSRAGTSREREPTGRSVCPSPAGSSKVRDLGPA